MAHIKYRPSQGADVLSAEDGTHQMKSWSSALSAEDDTEHDTANAAMGQMCYLLKMTESKCSHGAGVGPIIVIIL